MKKILNFLKTNVKIVILSSIIIVSLIICSSAIILNQMNKKDSYQKENNCIVQFETNGGTKIPTQSIACGTKINKPNNPEKEGFEFDNWYLNGEKFNFSSIINKSIIINAVYKEKTGTEYIEVSFDTDGGSKIDNIKIKKGEELTSPVNPTKDGYKFEGWFLNDIKFDFRTKLNENITLTAKWKKEKTSSNKNSNNSNKKTNNDIKDSKNNSDQKLNSSNNTNKNSNDNNNEKSNSKKNTISLSTSSISISTGTTSTFTMSYTPSDANWLAIGCNSNNGNAVLNTGYSADNVYTVTGIHPGNSVITCYNENGGTANRVTKTINVFVSKTSVTDMVLTTVGSLEVGHTGHMRCEVQPANAYNKSVTWSSSNPAIASIDNNGTIKANSAGTVTITATSNDNGISKSTNVLIYDHPKPTDVQFMNCPWYGLDVNVGDTVNIGAYSVPYGKSAIIYESKNGNASVDSNGNVTILGTGDVIIWAYAAEDTSVYRLCRMNAK